ncbi:hypothetical protein KS4_06690 [Poriferisphaera corsica]|uniref:Uncharacterized protein n=1 Tax=Poriferisphaera corsica TaxID=2528020 RepID=A0A517YQZ1_9BACT|nr:hypothetical protein KS4_06690 [Poriferisphaera corsica]
MGEGLEEVEGLSGGIDDSEEVHVFGFGKFLVDVVLHEFDEGVVEVVGVDEDDGTVVVFEVTKHHDFGEFFEGSDAAGEDDEGVGFGVHERFTFAHGLGDDELVGIGVGDLDVLHGFGDDAKECCAGGLCGACDFAHESDFAAAPDEGVVALADEGAEGLSGGFIGGINTVGSGAEDADFFAGGHGGGNLWGDKRVYERNMIACGAGVGMWGERGWMKSVWCEEVWPMKGR